MRAALSYIHDSCIDDDTTKLLSHLPMNGIPY